MNPYGYRSVVPQTRRTSLIAMLVGLTYTLVAIIGGLGIIMLRVSATMMWRSLRAAARRPVGWEALRADAVREVQRIGDESD